MKGLEEAPVEVINLNREQAELYHQEFIAYRDIEGRAQKTEHPVIVDGLVSDQPDQILKVGIRGNIENMSFEDYLSIMRINYVDYIKALRAPHNDGIDPVELVKKMHQGVIERRTGQAKKVKERARGNENQEQTAKDHSQFFVRLVNELGIDGLEATEALPREDFLDEVDEFLVFDKTAYETDGEKEGQKVYIGIQRSFNHKSLTSETVLVPEETDKGLIVKVFLKEELDDYEDSDGVTWFQRLLELRATKAKAKGMNPLSYAAENPKTNGIHQ